MGSRNSAFIYDPISKFENTNVDNSTILKKEHSLWVGSKRPYEAYYLELKSNYDHNRLSKIRAETVTFKFKGAEYSEDGSMKYPSSWYTVTDFSFDLT